jgi:hypothetical protein
VRPQAVQQADEHTPTGLTRASQAPGRCFGYRRRSLIGTSDGTQRLGGILNEYWHAA